MKIITTGYCYRRTPTVIGLVINATKVDLTLMEYEFLCLELSYENLRGGTTYQTLTFEELKTFETISQDDFLKIFNGFNSTIISNALAGNSLAFVSPPPLNL